MTDDYEPNATYSQVVLRHGRLRTIPPCASIREVKPPIRHVGIVGVTEMPQKR